MNRDEVIIGLINNVIDEAICHGGDIGGPYFSNKDNLEKAVKVLAETIGCSYMWVDMTKCWIMLVEDEKNE